jgi:3,4-dihydroxy 2-butanone 4-phosphate synthase/GTP cyclohydrolase II
MNGVLAPAGGEDRVAEARRIVAAGGKVLLAEGAGGGECAIVVAAQDITPRDIAFMTRQAGGPICLVLTADRCDELGLRPLGADADRTAFTVTVEAASGVTTGISASDQARTIRVAADPRQGPGALVSPGHVRPVRARRGGVLERPHTAEASVDLVRIAGRYAASVTCPVQREDGERTRDAELLRYAAKHDLHVLTVEDIRAFRRETEIALERGPSRVVKTQRLGTVEAVPFAEPGRADHLALVKGDVGGGGPAPVFVHAACRVGELLSADACDCRRRLDAALEGLAAVPAGVLVHVDAGLGAGCAQLAPPAVIARRVRCVLAELGVGQAAHGPV